MHNTTDPFPPECPWYRELRRDHWFVLIVAALGWLFDTMDQQLFVLAKEPAIRELLARDFVTPAASPARNSAVPATPPELPAAMVQVASGQATMIFMLGWATGGLVFGLFGDRWGRARTMMWTILLYSAFTGLSACSVHWWDFALYRFLTGMGVGGEWAAGVSLVAEVMPARARPYALALLQALSTVGNMTAAVLGLIVNEQIGLQGSLGGVSGWRLLFLIGALPAVLVLVIRRRLREPESWVRAKQSLAAAAPADELHRQLGDLRELFGDPRWRYHMLIGIALSTAGVMALWGVSFWTPELIRNNVLQDLPLQARHFWASIALLLQNAAAFFGLYGFGRLTARLGRRPAFAVAFLLAYAAIVLVFGFLNQRSQIWWMIPILGFCTFMPFSGYAIYFPELFPTRLRSTGTGFCYNVARYLAALAPLALGQLSAALLAHDPARRAQHLADLTWLSTLGSVDTAFRYAALAVASSLLVGLLILPFAPETRDRPLLD